MPDRILLAGDCDDDDADIAPSVTEVCDGRDQDCDGLVDEDALDARVVFDDGDGDGWGAGPSVRVCSPDQTQVDRDGDCDDEDEDIHPGAEDLHCDEVDSDCDGHAGGAAFTDDVGFDTLQAALDAATEGGVVDLCPGRHEESVIVRRSVTLRGLVQEMIDAEQHTLEDFTLAPPAGRALRTEGEAVDALRVEGIRFEGSGDAIDGSGGVIDVISRDLHLSRVHIEGGRAETGGGLSWFVRRYEPPHMPALTLDDVSFEGNVASQDGGGLSVFGFVSAGVGLHDVRFVSNDAGQRGGGACLGVGDGSTARGSAARLHDVTFEGNRGRMGGGLALRPSGPGVDMALREVSLVGNEASDGGGGIYLEHAGWENSLHINDSRLAENVAPRGAALLNDGATNLFVELTHVEIVDHTGSAPVVDLHLNSVRFAANYVSFAGNGGGFRIQQSATVDPSHKERVAFLTRHSTYLDTGTGPALEVEGDVQVQDTEFSRNGAGIVAEGDLRLYRVSFEDNVGADVSVSGQVRTGLGVVPYLSCVAGACSAEP